MLDCYLVVPKETTPWALDETFALDDDRTFIPHKRRMATTRNEPVPVWGTRETAIKTRCRICGEWFIRPEYRGSGMIKICSAHSARERGLWSHERAHLRRTAPENRAKQRLRNVTLVTQARGFQEIMEKMGLPILPLTSDNVYILAKAFRNAISETEGVK